MILLDTHALLWWALDPDALSKAAAQQVALMEREGGFASSISIWELGIKIARGKLSIGIEIADFARRIEQGGVVELLPVSTAIWLQSLELDWEHRDPADRVIVATALAKGVPLLTKDQTIQNFAEIRTIW